MLRRNTLQGLRGTRGGAVLGAAIRRAWGCNRHQVNCNFPAGSFRHASCIVPHRHRGAADREMLLAEEAQLSACLSSAMIRASQNPRRAPVGILRTMVGRRCHRGGGSRRAAVGLEAVIEAALWVGQKVRRLQNGGGLAAVACGKQSSAVSRITPAPCCDSRKDAQQAWADESENRVGLCCHPHSSHDLLRKIARGGFFFSTCARRIVKGTASPRRFLSCAILRVLLSRGY